MVKTHIAPLKSMGQRVSRVSVHVYASSLHIKTWNTCISHVYIQIDTERIALCHVKNGRKEGNEWAFEFHRRTRMIWLAKNRNVHLTKDLLVRRFLCYTVNICRHACKSLKSQWKFLSNAGTHDHILSLSLQITTKKKIHSNNTFSSHDNGYVSQAFPFTPTTHYTHRHTSIVAPFQFNSLIAAFKKNELIFSSHVLCAFFFREISVHSTALSRTSHLSSAVSPSRSLDNSFIQLQNALFPSKCLTA